MSKKKLLLIIAPIAFILNIIVILCVNQNFDDRIKLSFSLLSDKSDIYQVFYSETEEFSEDKSTIVEYSVPNKVETLSFDIPNNSKYIRIDFGNVDNILEVSDINIECLNKKLPVDKNLVLNSNKKQGIKDIFWANGYIEITTEGGDPFIGINLDNINLSEFLNNQKTRLNIFYKAILCIIIDIFLLFIFILPDKTLSLPIELYHNRKLILNLAKNDFKTKYAGSYLGIIWAFVQPVVSILVYWFVFQVGFKSAPVENFPFVLWLICGLVPWFFFSEALMNATNSMLEYSYLVKKVVFKISILPIVKIISALFVHAFFVVFTIVFFQFYGYVLDFYSLQVFYYTFCMFIFVLGISYATSAIVVFFKDLTQIINIFLQIGMWMTPILWSYTMLSENLRWFLKLNPMYYIVEGYRNALIYKVWFWENLNQTVYFWGITAIIFVVGAIIFKKLKIHFADVL